MFNDDEYTIENGAAAFWAVLFILTCCGNKEYYSKPQQVKPEKIMPKIEQHHPYHTVTTNQVPNIYFYKEHFNQR